MRLLFLGGDLFASGFGTVTRDLIRAFLDRGVDVRLLTFDDAIPPDNPAWLTERLVVVSHPRVAFDEIGPQMRARIALMFTAEGYVDGWAPDVALVVGDPASVERFGMIEMLPDGLPAFHYAAIEGVGLPPLWRRIWARIQPIAMAKFGAAEIGRLMGTEVPVIYHGVDTAVFHPATRQDPIVLDYDGQRTVVECRADAKRAFGIDPKTTVLLRTDANMPRKAYGELFDSVGPVLAAHPDVILFVHSPRTGQGGSFETHRSHVLERYGPGVASRVVNPGWHEKYGGMPRDALAALYNAADIYISNSSEGFGLTIAEAIACGTPAVGIGFSSVPEVIGPAGVTVSKVRLVRNIYSHFWAVAEEKAFGEAVDAMVRDKGLRWTCGGKGPEHVRSSFTWSHAAEQFAAIFEQSRELVAA